jgi:hypothetical protein
MPFDTNMITPVALGIALSACCGFRVFVPLLAAGLAAHFHWYQFAGDMQWLGSLPALVCFGTAALIEIAAYYFPFLDNILDAIAAPLAVIAGAVLAFAILPEGNGSQLLRWVAAIIAGGATAGTIHAGTGLLRLFSTKATLGVGNPVVASGENLLAVLGSVFSFIIPVVIAAVLLMLVIWIGYKGLKRLATGKPGQL